MVEEMDEIEVIMMVAVQTVQRAEKAVQELVIAGNMRHGGQLSHL